MGKEKTCLEKKKRFITFTYDLYTLIYAKLHTQQHTIRFESDTFTGSSRR